MSGVKSKYPIGSSRFRLNLKAPFMPLKPVQGSLDASQLRIGIVISRFNEFITEQLARGAYQVLVQHGCAEQNLRVISVPGAWELPMAALNIAADCDAIVAVGAVVRGDTPHFEYVASGTANGLARVSLDTGVPIAFGVLTTDDMQQAMDRAGGKSGNKGCEAAEAAIEMANLKRLLRNR
jgi:6,7-dimethyl-8-ribityllumazine synthase